MASLPADGRAVIFLSQIATAGEGLMPSFAVRVLAEEAGQPGLNELRRLFNERAVSNPNARELVESVARREGWGG